jgi:hypothetical protein
MFLRGSLRLQLQLDVSNSLPPCIGSSRTSKIVKTSSKYCTAVQYLALLRYTEDYLLYTKYGVCLQVPLVCWKCLPMVPQSDAGGGHFWTGGLYHLHMAP